MADRVAAASLPLISRPVIGQRQRCRFHHELSKPWKKISNVWKFFPCAIPLCGIPSCVVLENIMSTWVTQLRKGLIEFCILNLLTRGESYGYELLQALQEIEELVVTDSTVYPILSRLRKDGYLKVQVKPSTSGPPRRYFSLTSLGQQRVKEMNLYWGNLQTAIDNLRTGGTK
jgi:PadR family transcriptional regulator PadR